MSTKLCIRFGLVSGAAVGLLLGLLYGKVCCSPPVPPTVWQLSLDGLIVALIAVLLAAAFACLVLPLPIAQVLILAILIGFVVGMLLGPLAYHIPNPGLALFVCAILGAILGWLICRILCGTREAKLEVSR
jgi:hypothetical protein